MAPALPRLCAFALMTASLGARGESASKMPEPLVGESVTDIDGTEAGELELDLDGAMPAFNRATATWVMAAEAEARVTQRLGLAAEGELAGPLRGLTAGARVGFSWAILHDLERHVHVQVEANVRLYEGESAAGTTAVPLGDPALPYAGGVRAGVQLGRWTVRSVLGGEFGAPSAHVVPLRAGLAVLGSFGPGGAWGFAGVDALADWGNRSPFVLARAFRPTCSSPRPSASAPRANPPRSGWPRGWCWSSTFSTGTIRASEAPPRRPENRNRNAGPFS